MNSRALGFLVEHDKNKTFKIFVSNIGSVLLAATFLSLSLVLLFRNLAQLSVVGW